MSRDEARLTVSRSSEEELDAAYKLGLEQGRMEAKFGPLLEALPAFEPWTTGAHFERKRSWFDSLVAYERSVTGSLREAEKVRWALERTLARLELEIEAAAEDSMPLSTRTHRLLLSRLLRIASGRAPALDPHTELEDCKDEINLVDRIQAIISNQLYLVRQAVDAELEYGRGHAWTIEAMRSPPQRPRGVRELAGVQVFVAGDQRRGYLAVDGHLDAGGEDYGFRWRLEHPLLRWRTTRWRISWLCITDNPGDLPTYEVYAIEFPHERLGETGRVWLLGEIHSRATIEALLPELEKHAQEERNSLVVASQQIQNATRAERHRRGPMP
jgi:hypothetical protein